MATAFKTEIINGKDRGGSPVVNLGMCSFMYTREENVYVVAVTRANANAMLAFTVTEIRSRPPTSLPASLPASSPSRALAEEDAVVNRARPKSMTRAVHASPHLALQVVL
jgi:hypothetical protein